MSSQASGYPVGMNCMALSSYVVKTNIHHVACVIIALAACNVGCQTTTTPVNESQWLPKQDTTAVEQIPAPEAAQKPIQPLVKPWDVPDESAAKSDLSQPNLLQMRECLAGATWIKLDENGTRRRSLQFNADGTFVAKSDGESGELPVFAGLVVQAKGRWDVKSDGLRLMPNAGDPVVVQLQWLGDKRLVMMNGESWMRSQ